MDLRTGGCCGEDHRRSGGAAVRRAHDRQRRDPHGRPPRRRRRHARAPDLHRDSQVLRDKSSIRPERVSRFQETLTQVGIAPEHVVVHAAYVLNTATSDEEKWGRASAGLRKELERSSALGVGAVCFHPGAATGGDRAEAVARVARAITAALEAVKGTTRILVENTAGAGLTVGRTAEEVGAILAAVPAPLRPRTGYGLDTCHLY